MGPGDFCGHISSFAYFSEKFHEECFWINLDFAFVSHMINMTLLVQEVGLKHMAFLLG